MHPQTVFAKTSKGVLEIKSKTIKPPQDVGLVFLSVDGKSTVADLAQKSGLSGPQLDEALDKLVADGYIKIFAAPGAPAAADLAAMIGAEKRQYAEQQAETAAKTRELAERQAKATAQENSESRRRAQAEANANLAEQAVARAQAIAQEAARAKAKAEVERQARAKAEDRAKAEAVARVVSEQQTRARAEEEVKTRVIAEPKARELAQVEEDARYRQEAAVRARSTAEDRRKREDEARNAAVAVRKPPSWPKTVAIALVALIGIAVAALHFVPLNGYIAGARQVLSQRLGVPVDISELRYALLPSPKLTLQGVALGSLQEVKIRQRRRRRGSLRAARGHEGAR